MVSHSEAVQKQVNSCVTKSTELNREKDDDYAFIRQYKRDSDKKKLHERHKTVIVQSISYKVPVIYKYHLHLIENFDQCCLRTIPKVHWSRFIINSKLLDSARAIRFSYQKYLISIVKSSLICLHYSYNSLILWLMLYKYIEHQEKKDFSGQEWMRALQIELGYLYI